MKWLAGGTFIALLFLAPLIGMLSQSLAPWWFGQQARATGTGAFTIGDIPIGPLPQINDEQRYAFAVTAGWSTAQAITATAISIAENGSGNPAALSSANFNGSRDLGMMQINSAWWPRFGGQAVLIDPATNFRAGYAIYLIQGWCAWSTYLASCGPGHTGSFAAFMNRAERAANTARHQ